MEAFGFDAFNEDYDAFLQDDFIDDLDVVLAEGLDVDDDFDAVAPPVNHGALANAFNPGTFTEHDYFALAEGINPINNTKRGFTQRNANPLFDKDDAEMMILANRNHAALDRDGTAVVVNEDYQFPELIANELGVPVLISHIEVQSRSVTIEIPLRVAIVALFAAHGNYFANKVDVGVFFGMSVAGVNNDAEMVPAKDILYLDDDKLDVDGITDALVDRYYEWAQEGMDGNGSGVLLNFMDRAVRFKFQFLATIDQRGIRGRQLY